MQQRFLLEMFINVTYIGKIMKANWMLNNGRNFNNLEPWYNEILDTSL